MALHNETTALILVGASEFASKNFHSDESFRNAKERIERYFLDSNGLKIKKSCVLDLFNSTTGPNDQDHRIEEFLIKINQDRFQDLFIFYVGHGAFDTVDESFVLTLASTRDSNLSVSSMTIKSLSKTISQFGGNLRIFIILDCCFAASAGVWMSPADTLVHEFVDKFPSKGVTLLCSSSKDSVSRLVPERLTTMFTESFELALRNGDSSINRQLLSLRDIHQITYSNIKRLNKGKAVRPEIKSPFQPEGDLADLPVFKNNAVFNAKYDVYAKRDEVEKSIIENDLIKVKNTFIDFMNSFDLHKEFRKQTVLTSSDLSDLIDQEQHFKHEEFRKIIRPIYFEILDLTDKIFSQQISN